MTLALRRPVDVPLEVTALQGSVRIGAAEIISAAFMTPEAVVASIDGLLQAALLAIKQEGEGAQLSTFDQWQQLAQTVVPSKR
jgi:hypothetical protein